MGVLQRVKNLQQIKFSGAYGKIYNIPVNASDIDNRQKIIYTVITITSLGPLIIVYYLYLYNGSCLTLYWVKFLIMKLLGC